MRNVITELPGIAAASLISAFISLAVLSAIGEVGFAMFLVLWVLWAVVFGRISWKEQKRFEEKLEEARTPKQAVTVIGTQHDQTKNFSPLLAWGDFTGKKFISIDRDNGLVRIETQNRGVRYFDASFFTFYRVNADTTLITEGKVGGSPAIGMMTGGVGIGYSMSKTIKQTTREHKKYKLQLFYEGNDKLLKDIEIDFQDNVKPLEQVVYALEKAVTAAGSTLMAPETLGTVIEAQPA